MYLRLYHLSMRSKKNKNQEPEEVIEETAIEEMEEEEFQEEQAEDADPIPIGQKVPSLTGLQWIKGEPMDVGQSLTLVELWATWCGPCLYTIPHLTSLQEKYKDKLSIIGLTVEEKKTVVPFVKEQGKNMEYRVAIAPEEIYNQYQAGIDGIPHAFLVDEKGRLLWQCHPLEVESVIEKVIDGTYTLSQLKSLANNSEKLRELVESYYETVSTPKAALKSFQKIYDLAKTLTKTHPGKTELFQKLLYLGNYINDTYEELEFNGVQKICELFDDPSNSSEDFAHMVQFLNSQILLESRPFEIMIKWIDLGIKKEPKSIYVMIVYAEVLFTLGLVKKAISLLKKALKIESTEPAVIKQLEIYQKIETLQGKVNL